MSDLRGIAAPEFTGFAMVEQKDVHVNQEPKGIYFRAASSKRSSLTTFQLLRSISINC